MSSSERFELSLESIDGSGGTGTGSDSTTGSGGAGGREPAVLPGGGGVARATGGFFGPQALTPASVMTAIKVVATTENRRVMCRCSPLRI